MSDHESEQALHMEASTGWLTSPDVVEVLTEAVPNYEDCKTATERNTVIKTVKRDLSALLGDRSITLPKNISAVIAEYLENNSVVNDDKQLGPAGLPQRNWTARQVFVAENRERICVLCNELAGTTERQGKEWLAKYQPAVKQLFGELDEDAVEALRQTAVEWNRYGPSGQVQDELFQKYAGRDVDAFIKRMSLSYGASVAMMVIHRKGKQIEVYKQAARPSQGQSPFWESDTALSSQQVVAAATAWGQKQHRLPEDGKEEEDDAGTSKKSEISLTKGNTGHFSLNGHNWRAYTSQRQNMLVLNMVRAAYRLMRRSDTARTPWKDLAEEAILDDDERKLITSEYAPLGWVWSDPHKLNRGEAAKVLSHWAERENQALPAVVFKGCRPIEPKRKKPSYVEPDEQSDSQHRQSSKNKTHRQAKRQKTRKTAKPIKKISDSDSDDIATPPPRHPVRHSRGAAKKNASTSSSEAVSSSSEYSHGKDSSAPSDQRVSHKRAAFGRSSAKPPPSADEVSDEDMDKETEEEIDELNAEVENEVESQAAIDEERKAREQQAEKEAKKKAEEEEEEKKDKQRQAERKAERMAKMKAEEEEEERQEAERQAKRREKRRAEEEADRREAERQAEAKAARKAEKKVKKRVDKEANKEENAAPKKSTVARSSNRPACNACRTAKVACDRSSPCSRCEKTNRACVYNSASATASPVYASSGPDAPDPSRPIFADLLAKIFPETPNPSPVHPRIPEILKKLGDMLDFVRNAMWSDVDLVDNMPFPAAFQLHPDQPLPADFHAEDGVLEFLRWFEDRPYVTSEHPQFLVKSDDWIRVLTGLARAYKDVLIVNQLEPDVEVAPVYQNSAIVPTAMLAFDKTTSAILRFVSDSKFSPPSGAPI